MVVARFDEKLALGKTIIISAAKHNNTPALSDTNETMQKKTPTLGIISRTLSKREVGF